MLPQEQAQAFGQKYAGVEERADAQFFQLLGRYAEDPHQNSVNVPVLRIDAQHLHPVRYRTGKVFVQELDGADADRDQERGFE